MSSSVSITRRTLVANAVVFAAAFLLLVVTPVTVSAPISGTELAILIAGGLAMLVINWALVRRAMAPLRELSSSMELIELREGAVEMPTAGSQVREVEAVTQALATMIDRLAQERMQTSRAVLAGQEGERLRVARELHDEVGQGLIAIGLMAERAASSAPTEQAAQFEEITAQLHFYLDELRRIAHELRPEMLDDLGLVNALIALSRTEAQSGGPRIERAFDTELPPLPEEHELVVYRVAQEAFTNAIRHAQATLIRMRFGVEGDAVVLEVVDDGIGIGADADLGDGIGLKGMRERARLISGALVIGPGPGGTGTAVRLTIPLGPEG